MDARAALRAGELEPALQILQQTIRQNPADAMLRRQLLHVLCVLGEWERAEKQLVVIEQLDLSDKIMVSATRALIKCEQKRDRVHQGKQSAHVLGEPPYWISLMVQSMSLSDHKSGAKEDLIGQALEAAPMTPGSLNGEAFQWLADCDSTLGPTAELYVNGEYYWVPLECIQSIRFSPPEDLRDLVWSSVDIEWTNGGKAVGFMPVRYNQTVLQADTACLLARSTVWNAVGDKPDSSHYYGTGQRMFCSDVGDYSVLDVESIEFNPPSGGAV